MNVLDFHVSSLYFVGDIHGDYNAIKYFIKRFDINNTLMVFCGDCGIGFAKHGFYEQVFGSLKKGSLSPRNNYCVFIRGNHDDPMAYARSVYNMKRLKTVPDYSILRVCSLDREDVHQKNILCIGGAISMDRQYRIRTMEENANKYLKYHNSSWETALSEIQPLYWKSEACFYDDKTLASLMERNIKIDVVATHTAPSFCSPLEKGSLSEWAVYDEKLEEDIDKERKTMDKVYKNLIENEHPLKEWYYGHYHFHHFEKINNVGFHLLDMSREGLIDAVECKI